MLKWIIPMVLVLVFHLPCPLLASEKSLVITPDMQFVYANDLYEKSDYSTSVVEFKRFLHFFPDHEKKETAQFKMGLGLFKLENYYEAARVFNSIVIKDKLNKTTTESVFMQHKAFLKLENYGYARIVLQNYLMLVEDVSLKDRIHFNFAKSYIAQARKEPASGTLQKAREYLTLISPAGGVKYRVGEYKRLIRMAENAGKKDPVAAGLLAAVPGAGFLYCERYKDAVTTFILNIGLMYAAFEAFDNDSPVLGSIIGLVEAGFYTGGIYGSVSSAHKFNNAQRLKILNKNFSLSTGIDPVNKAFQVSLGYDF